MKKEKKTRTEKGTRGKKNSAAGLRASSTAAGKESHASVAARNVLPRSSATRDKGKAAGTIRGREFFRAQAQSSAQGLASRMQKDCMGRNLARWTESYLPERINIC